MICVADASSIFGRGFKEKGERRGRRSKVKDQRSKVEGLGGRFKVLSCFRVRCGIHSPKATAIPMKDQNVNCMGKKANV